MKLNKIFAFTLASLAFAACNDSSVEMVIDTPELNTAEGVVVGMAQPELTVNEDNGERGRTFVVPVQLSGVEANGAVKVTAKVEGYGVNPAVPFSWEIVDGVTVSSGNYIVASNTVYVSADGTFGIEITTVPDQDINDDRQLVVTILEVAGAELDAAATTCVVTLRDNDKPLDWQWIGSAILNDQILSGEELEVPCYIKEGPGVLMYKLENPWSDEGEDFVLDCSADEGVVVPEFDTGYYYASMGGNMVLMSYSYYAAQQGVSIDAFAVSYPEFNITKDGNTIMFPENAMLCHFGGSSLYYANDAMTIEVPSAPAADQVRKPYVIKDLTNLIHNDFVKTGLTR